TCSLHTAIHYLLTGKPGRQRRRRCTPHFRQASACQGFSRGLTAKWHLNRSQFGIRIDHDLASISDHSLASQSITIWHASDH
ncbi:hypothetical protein ACUTGT_26010, partial [Escherichia coli]